MKKKKLLLLILLLILFNYLLALNVSGLNYELGISEEESFIWEVEKYEKETYLTYFEEPDYKEGDQQKIKISRIKEQSDKWVVSYYVWEYSKNTDKFSEKADDEDSMKIYFDPEDQGEKVYDILDITEMWIIPTPLTNYLEEFENEFDHPIINIDTDDDGTLRAKYDIENIEYEVKMTYTLDGVAEKIEFIDSTGDKFVKINILREERIPGYEYLIPVTLVCCLISVIVWRKKLKIDNS